MENLIITVGASGSGKSTYCKTYSLDNKCLIISTDEKRKELTGNVSSQSMNQEVFESCYKVLRETEEETVIFDSTALSWEYVSRIIDKAKQNKMPPKNIEIDMFETSNDFDECLKRVKTDIANNVDRSNVPEDVIRKQVDNYKKMLTSMGDFLRNIDRTHLLIRSIK